MAEYAWMVVRVTLDPTPGMFHTPEQARDCVENRLRHMLPSAYDPKVNYVNPERLFPEEIDDLQTIMNHQLQERLDEEEAAHRQAKRWSIFDN
jgi:hypothetical protein